MSGSIHKSIVCYDLSSSDESCVSENENHPIFIDNSSGYILDRTGLTNMRIKPKSITSSDGEASDSFLSTSDDEMIDANATKTNDSDDSDYVYEK